VKTLIESAGIISALIIALFALSQAWLALNYRRSKLQMRDASPRNKWQGPLPRILLQLPVYNERYVIERLLDAVAKLDYPAKLLTVQLLDDSTDETFQIAATMVSAWKKRGVKFHHIHRVDRIGYKAGALQAGLELDNSDFVAIFDADFIPQPDFLKKVIGYFCDSSIGMVQTRWEHLNSEYSLLTKLLSFGIDAHFSVEQGGRQATHSFLNFNGTAGIWRRKAIDQAGGWHNDCLTEDLDLSFRTQLLGWRFLFVENIATPSELPAEMSAIRTQQFRWTKGAAETARKNLANLWGSGFPLVTKFIGSFHMLNSLVFPVLVLLGLSAAAFPFAFGDQAQQNYAPINALLIVAYVAILFTYWVAHKHGGLNSSAKGTVAILARAFLFMLITIGLSLHNGLAVLQGWMGRATPFIRTPKLNIAARGKRIKRNHAYIGTVSSPLFIVELGLALLFSGLAIYGFAVGHYSLIPTYLYFAGGFLMVVYFTIGEFYETQAKTSNAAPILKLAPGMNSMSKKAEDKLS
jgi:cellulose synthase/poly-beta-1,6-N-acetylglucosamine synthase-like glycosyltransferase